MNQYARLIKKVSLNSGAFLVATVLSMFLAEGILAVLNFPTESYKRIAHPVGYEEIRSTLEFEYAFTTNDRGLRYHNIPAEKPTNSHRVFVAGDSFTEGYGVATGRRFTDLLEGHFSSLSSPVLFINGGLSGTGPQQFGTLFVNVGLEYNVDGLLIVLYPNDVWDSNQLEENPFSKAFPARAGIKKIAHDGWPRLYTLLYTVRDRQFRRRTAARTSEAFVPRVSRMARERGIPESDIERWKETLPRELVDKVDQGRFNGGEMANGLLHPHYWTESIDVSSDVARYKWRTMTEYLSQILAIADERGIEKAIVFIPSPLLYDKRKHSGDTPGVDSGPEIHERWLSEDTQIQQKLRQWTIEGAVPFLDLTPILRRANLSGQALNFELDEHLNNLGHQVVADAIASWLSDQQVFSFAKYPKH